MRFSIESTSCDSDEKLLERYPWLDDYHYENHHITIDTFEEFKDVADKIQKNGLISFYTYDHDENKWVLADEPRITIYDNEE